MSSIVLGRTELEIRDKKKETGNRKKDFRKVIKKGYELRLTFLSSIVSERTEQEIRDRKQETGNRTGKRNLEQHRERIGI